MRMMFLFLRVPNILRRKSVFWQWFPKVVIGEICQKKLPKIIWVEVGCLVAEKRVWLEDCHLMSLL